MAESEDVKQQRDRFLAFAFSNADLMVEVSIDGSILFALGASKAMTGLNEKDIIGKNWLNLFSVYDQAQILHTYENSKTGQRCGPLLVDLNELVTKRKAIFSGMKLPGSNKFYVTLAFGTLLMSKIAGEIGSTPSNELLNREAFIHQAQDTFDLARSLGQDVTMSVFDMDITHDLKKRIPKEKWDEMMESIAMLMRTKAVDRQAAGEITAGRFSLIHDKDTDPKVLKNQLISILKQSDPDGKGCDITIKTIASDLDSLSSRDAGRALVYTINEFERKGTAMSIGNLNNGFIEYAASHEEKVKEFHALIERLDFSLYFQPVVDLKTMDVHHYEMLSRFKKGDTLEWVTFGEDMGLSTEFDMAVIERAVSHINFKAGVSRTRFSANISGQSIEDETFFKNLQEQLTKGKTALHERLQFEITDSNYMRNIPKANKHIAKLRDQGYIIVLDDVDASDASFILLSQLKVDMVKIDGKHIRKLLSSQRDAAMVKKLAEVCREKGIDVIAEYVEDMTQAEILKEIGIKYGQGYLFGKAESAPTFTPPRK